VCGDGDGFSCRQLLCSDTATANATAPRELRYLYATREETFFHGSRQALLNHTERMLELEREYSLGSRSAPRLMRCGPARAPAARRASQPAANGRTSTCPAQATRDGGQGDVPLRGVSGCRRAGSASGVYAGMSWAGVTSLGEVVSRAMDPSER
jgi:hypothetical protein